VLLVLSAHIFLADLEFLNEYGIFLYFSIFLSFNDVENDFSMRKQITNYQRTNAIICIFDVEGKSFYFTIFFYEVLSSNEQLYSSSIE
jgi:hypothetical protein